MGFKSGRKPPKPGQDAKSLAGLDAVRPPPPVLGLTAIGVGNARKQAAQLNRQRKAIAQGTQSDDQKSRATTRIDKQMDRIPRQTGPKRS